MKFQLNSVQKLSFGFTAVWLAILVYFFNPVLSLDSTALYLLLLIGSAPTWAAFTLVGDGRGDVDINFKGAIAPAALLLMVFVIIPATHYLPGAGDRYGKLIGDIEVVTDAKLPDLDIDNAPVVSESLALKKAQMALAQAGDLSSQVRLGELAKQEVNGKLVYVAYLEPTGFFRWLALDGTPGYVVVSASDESDVRFVDKVDGKPLALRYTLGAYGSQDAARRVWMDHSKSLYVKDFTPELDDQGNPYYVATVLEKKVFFGGLDAVGVIVLNPQTGESKRYSIADAPAWVDIVQPSNIVANQLDDAGEFVKGRFNFADEGKFAITNLDQVFTKQGESFYVAGITNYAGKGGIQAFVFVNTRTKKAYRYEVKGTLEANAQKIIEKMFPGKDYEASNAIPYLIGGKPVYVMSLFNGEAVFGYGLVSVEDSSQFASAPTIREAYIQFTTSSFQKGMGGSTSANLTEINGVVRRIGQEASTGNFKVLLNEDTVIYTISASASDFLAVTQPGDSIRIKGTKFNEQSINVVSFENLSLLK